MIIAWSGNDKWSAWCLHRWSHKVARQLHIFTTLFFRGFLWMQKKMQKRGSNSNSWNLKKAQKGLRKQPLYILASFVGHFQLPSLLCWFTVRRVSYVMSMWKCQCTSYQCKKCQCKSVNIKIIDTSFKVIPLTLILGHIMVFSSSQKHHFSLFRR